MLMYTTFTPLNVSKTNHYTPGLTDSVFNIGRNGFVVFVLGSKVGKGGENGEPS